MFNFHNKKTQRIISTIIIVIVIVAMLIPTLTYFMQGFNGFHFQKRGVYEEDCFKYLHIVSDRISCIL